MTTNEALIASILCRLLPCQPEEVGPQTPFSDLGLDSLGAVRLLDQLERRLGRDIDPMLVLDCPCIASLAAELDRLTAPQALAA